MKARFTEKQDPVTWNALPDGNVDVMICLNEKTVTETYPDTDPETEQTVFEYDFNQFREKQEKISEETVRASPEKYLKYIPEKEKSTEQKFAEQAERDPGNYEGDPCQTGNDPVKTVWQVCCHTGYISDILDMKSIAS